MEPETPSDVGYHVTKLHELGILGRMDERKARAVGVLVDLAYASRWPVTARTGPTKWLEALDAIAELLKG